MATSISGATVRTFQDKQYTHRDIRRITALTETLWDLTDRRLMDISSFSKTGRRTRRAPICTLRKSAARKAHTAAIILRELEAACVWAVLGGMTPMQVFGVSPATSTPRPRATVLGSLTAQYKLSNVHSNLHSLVA